MPGFDYYMPDGPRECDLKASRSALLSQLSSCQGSSVVEQGTHKPLVGSSTLPPGTGLDRKAGEVMLISFESYGFPG